MNSEEALNIANVPLIRKPSKTIPDLLRSPIHQPVGTKELSPIVRKVEFPGYLNNLSKTEQLIAELEIPHESEEAKRFVLSYISLIGESFEESDIETKFLKAVKIIADVDNLIQSGKVDLLTELIVSLYSQNPEIHGYKRSLFGKALIKLVEARYTDLETDKPVEGSMLTVKMNVLANIKAQLLEKNIATVIQTAASLFDKLAKTDKLASVIREMLKRENTTGIETTFAEIQNLSHNRLHGVAAIIIWQFKKKLENYKVEPNSTESLTELLNKMSQEIIDGWSIEDIGNPALKIMITTVLHLIGYGDDPKGEIVSAKTILLETYNMPALQKEKKALEVETKNEKVEEAPEAEVIPVEEVVAEVTQPEERKEDTQEAPKAEVTVEAPEVLTEIPELTRENYKEVLKAAGIPEDQIKEIMTYAESKYNEHFLEMINFVVKTIKNEGEKSPEELAEVIFEQHFNLGLTYNSQDWYAILRRCSFVLRQKVALDTLWRLISILSVKNNYKQPTLKVWANTQPV